MVYSQEMFACISSGISSNFSSRIFLRNPLQTNSTFPFSNAVRLFFIFLYYFILFLLWIPSASPIGNFHRSGWWNSQRHCRKKSQRIYRRNYGRNSQNHSLIFLINGRMHFQRKFCDSFLWKLENLMIYWIFQRNCRNISENKCWTQCHKDIVGEIFDEIAKRISKLIAAHISKNNIILNTKIQEESQ